MEEKNKIMNLDYVDTFGDLPEIFWCLHCERTYKPEQVRVIIENGERFEMCHYEDCSGDAVMHAKNYFEWPMEPNDNKYPSEPIYGVVYPLYPSDDEKRELYV